MAAVTRFHGSLDDSPDTASSPRTRLRALMRQAERERTQQKREDGPTPTGRDPGTEELTPEPEGGSRAGPSNADPPTTSTPVRRAVRRWLPESWSRARVDPGRYGRRGIALAAVVALAVVGVVTWLDRPVPEPAPAAPVQEQVAAPPVQQAAAPPPADLVVSVVGEVSRPGLVTLRPGERVADALDAAGGALPGTDITTLNLARRLVDGEQLYVAVPVPPGAQPGGRQASTPEPGGAGSKVDLNTATEEQLDALPGIGQVTAERIVQWREQHGRFGSVDQLGDVEGIGDTRMERLRELVRA